MVVCDMCGAVAPVEVGVGAGEPNVSSVEAGGGAGEPNVSSEEPRVPAEEPGPEPGPEPGVVPLTWITSVENGKHRVHCNRCSREHLRSIEAKLDSEWW